MTVDPVACAQIDVPSLNHRFHLPICFNHLQLAGFGSKFPKSSLDEQKTDALTFGWQVRLVTMA